jgi:peptidoglycan/xylan/chitin deacetylase (PgdA/CDA1 family)
MINRLSISGFIFILFLSATFAQTPDKTAWNNKKCAVVLTYDDGINGHLDMVIPSLDSVGLKGTFYIVPGRDVVRKRLDDWRKVAANGHELGNHTLFHPCIAKTKERDYSSWVLPEYDLNNYSITRIVDEIKMANTFLQALDGKVKRTIAYPCGDCFVNDTANYIPFIKGEFVGGRGGSNFTEIGHIDVYKIAAIGIDDKYSGQQLIELVKKAMETNSLLVFLFHGVGGDHNTNIALSKHNELIRFLKKNEKDIWVAPLVEVAEYITKFKP